MRPSWGPSGTSDKRLKENIRSLDSNTLQTFYKQLNPIIFNYKEEVNEKGTYFGVFAQDVEKALEAIHIDDSRLVYENEKGYKNLSYCATIGLQIGAIKDLYEIVNRQQSQIDTLKQQLARLKGEQNG